MLFDCSGYGEDAITSYNLLFYPSRKALKITLFFTQDCLVFQKGLLLHSKRTPFTLQNDSFCNPKRTLLQLKRTPFEKRRKFKGKVKREKVEIRWIFYTLQNKNDTNPRLPPCPCRSYLSYLLTAYFSLRTHTCLPCLTTSTITTPCVPAVIVTASEVARVWLAIIPLGRYSRTSSSV